MRARLVMAVAGVVSLALLCATALVATQESVAELQARFDREGDSKQKVKILHRLGPAQLADAHRAGKQNDYQTLGFELEKYRDNVRVALQALKGQHPKPQKATGSYRDLEIQVRKSLRDVDDAILAAPQEYRPPLQLVHKDLEAIDDELLHLLFPDRPGEKTAPRPPTEPGGQPAIRDLRR